MITGNQFGQVVAASCMAAAGSLVFLTLPLLIGLMINHLGLSEQQAGLVASSYFTTYLLASGSSFLWVKRYLPRVAALFAYLVMGVGLSLAALVQSGWLLVATSMALAGLGGGVLFSLGVDIIARGEQPDRNFGWLLVAQQLLAAIYLLMTPGWSLSITMLCSALVSLALALTVILVTPRPQHPSTHHSPVSLNHSHWYLALALASLVINFAGLSALWAFVERIGSDSGLDATELGRALSISMLAGLMGALVVTQVAGRYGRQAPLWLAGCLFTLITFGYSRALEWLAFAVLTGCLSFAWNFVLAYQMAIVAGLDKSGTHSALIPAAQAGGAMLGPAIGGWLVGSSGGHAAMLIVVTVMILLSIGAFSVLSTRMD